jgi:hypothetical protein
MWYRFSIVNLIVAFALVVFSIAYIHRFGRGFVVWCTMPLILAIIILVGARMIREINNAEK